jgi:3-deoxy-D-manno-octulosonic-acid transferase
VQDEASKKLLASIEIKAVVAGDTRFDRVAAIAAENKSLEDIDHFCQSQKVMIAGSTWKVDIDQLKAALPNDFFEQYRLIIVPHDVNESNLAYIETQFPGKTYVILLIQTKFYRLYSLLIALEFFQPFTGMELLLT